MSYDFEAALCAAARLTEETGMAAGVGLKPDDDRDIAIHVFACDVASAVGFPKTYEGFDVVVDIVPKYLDDFDHGLA